MTRSELKTSVVELARTLLADVPRRIGPLLATEKSAEACRRIIEAAIVEALAGLEDAAPGRRN
jgi:hypothetical protein